MELSKSNRSICKICKKRMNKNLPRLVYLDYGTNFCDYNCFGTFIKQKTKELKERIKQLEDSKKEMERLIKKHSREICIDKLK